ncbi:MAG TPA: inositol monophosphatase family protein [Hyphomonadaceae bacterium]|nr:inositol monophosphatase family protein [Hyphomonadaceae bacterium]
MSRPSPTVTVMMDAARAAGRRLIRDFGEVENLQVSRKGPSDFVSAADQKAEEIIRKSLEKTRPGYGFLLEEGGEVKGSDKTHRFIIDPLDGTLNFLHGIPHFAVSIALERDGKLRAGVVFDPMRNEMFWAEEGAGAWLENKRLRVASRKKLAEAVVTTGIPQLGVDGAEKFLDELTAVRAEVAAVRRFGSAALDLAWVAAGRFDGFWERGLSAWDIAAGFVLVQEAGGMILGLDRKDAIKGSFVASNTSLAQKLAERIEGKVPKKTAHRLLRPE